MAQTRVQLILMEKKPKKATRTEEMLLRLEVEAEDCAYKIINADAAIAKASRDTKTLSEWLKGIVPSVIEWSTSLHWVEEDE